MLNFIKMGCFGTVLFIVFFIAAFFQDTFIEGVMMAGFGFILFLLSLISGFRSKDND